MEGNRARWGLKGANISLSPLKQMTRGISWQATVLPENTSKLLTSDFDVLPLSRINWILLVK